MRTLPLALLVVALLPGAVSAQQSGSGTTVSFESYRFGAPDETGAQSVSLLAVPFAARVPLFGGAALDLGGAYASGSLRLADGSSATLRGFTDTQLGLVVPVRRDVATITLVAVLPTGKQREDPTEAMVAGMVAADLLPFRISNWGAGGGAGVSAGAAHEFGAFGAGASVSYLVGRRYDLLDQTGFAYRPGNQLRARVALDEAVGPAAKASLQLTYLHTAKDDVDGTNLFRVGDRFQAIGSYAFAAGARATGLLYAGLLARAHGSYLFAPTAGLPAQVLYLAGGGFRLPAGGLVLLPSADMRVLRRNDGQNQGLIGSVGSTAELTLGSGRLVLLPEARARFGRVQLNPGSESGFTGFEIGLGARLGGRP